MPPKKKKQQVLEDSPVLTEGTSEGETSDGEHVKSLALRGKKLRGNSFVADYCNVDVAMMSRLPTMLKGRGASTLIPRAPEGDDRLLLVFDLDETIIYARDGPLMLRPFAKELLRSVGEVFEVALWTAGARDYAKAVLNELNKEVWGGPTAGPVKHLITRNKKWYNAADYTKDLKKLGRDMDRTIIIENTPDCVRLNPENAIILEDYEGSTDTGPTLQALNKVLLDLAKSKKTVSQFLKSCKMLKKQMVSGQDADVEVYYLSTDKGAVKEVKENKDRKPAAKNSKKRKVEDDDDDESEEEDVKPKPKPKGKGTKRAASSSKPAKKKKQ